MGEKSERCDESPWRAKACAWKATQRSMLQVAQPRLKKLSTFFIKFFTFLEHSG